MKTKTEAEQIGREMLNRLGDGWKMKVFQNMEWHVYAYCGSIHVSAQQWNTGDTITYMCLISDRPDEHTSGSSIWTSNRRGNMPSFTDPVEAVLFEVQHAQTIVNRLVGVMAKSQATISKFCCNACGKKRI